MLDGLRVLDLSDHSGYACGRILADLGADVVAVEPPCGSAGRLEPPFADYCRDPRRSLTWLVGNVNKRGITCNLDTLAGSALFRCLVEHADVVIETFTPGELERLDLGYDRLSNSNPRLVLTSITPYGQAGPCADLPASDLEVTAASGSLWLAGEPDGPPVRTSAPQTPAWAGMMAAVGTMMALFARETIGRGQHVDVSAQASALTAVSHAPVFWDLLKENPARSGAFLTGRSISGAVFRNIWHCRDGYITFALYGGPAGRHTLQQLVAWMEERGGAPDVLRELDWEHFDVTAVTPGSVCAIEAAIAPFFEQLTRSEIFDGFMQRDMLGYPVATAEDIYADEQLSARAFWTPLSAPWDGQTLAFPGSFALFDGERPAIRRTAPRLGEHNAEIYGGELGLSPSDLAALQRAGAI